MVHAVRTSSAEIYSPERLQITFELALLTTEPDLDSAPSDVGKEGRVLYLDNQHMIKAMTNWYLEAQKEAYINIT